jgi:hypothetical protein
MDIPVVVGSRLRFRIRWRFMRLLPREDGHEIGIWGHPALRVAMTPAGLEFNQIDWYTITISYKRRHLPRESRGLIEPARLLVGVTFRSLGFLYVGLYLSDWAPMLRRGQLPVEVGRLRPDRPGAERRAG